MFIVLTHLLGDHNDARGLSRTTDSWNCEQLNESCEEVVGLRNARLPNKLFLVRKLCRYVIKISSGLELGVAKTLERRICFLGLSFFQIPSRRLWAKPDPQNKRYCRNEGRAQLETPGDGSDSVDSKVCRYALCKIRASSHDLFKGMSYKKDTKCRPQLPTHHKSATNVGRTVLCTKGGQPMPTLFSRQTAYLKTGTVTSFRPMPMPRRMRQATN